MKKISIKNMNIILLILALFSTIITMILGSYVQQGYDLYVGGVAQRTFVASHQIENRLETERLRQIARENVFDVTVRDNEVEERIYTELVLLFESINQLREIYSQHLTLISLPQLPQPVNSDIVLENEILVEEEYDLYETEVMEAISPISEIPFFEQFQNQAVLQNSSVLSNMSEYNLDILMTTETSLFSHLQNTVMEVFSTIMTIGVAEEHNYGFENNINSQLAMRGISYPLNHIAFLILNTYIEPNIIVDEESTERIREERASDIVPVVFLQNQVIINEGQIITEEIYAVLTDLGYITDGYTINHIPVIGAIVIILVMFSVAVFYIYLFAPYIHNQKKHTLLLFTLYMILVISTSLFSNFPFVFVPQLIFTMLVGMLLNNYKLAIVTNIAVTIITFLVFDGDISFILYFLTTGTVVAIITRYALQRNKVVIFSLLISIISSVVSLSVRLLVDRTVPEDSLTIVAYSFAAGFFSVIICMGTLPLWESIFGVITPIKLLDLTNPSNELLRRLSIEAPGTYHHSIIVSNLAEAAAYDIKADTVITRVGAFFHDIGKLRYPAFFIENQMGINPHDEIYPLDSAEIITDHAKYGTKLADQYKLPLVLRDIIEQHHGTTVLKFFFDKEVKLTQQEIFNAEPEKYNDPSEIKVDIDESLFRYNGPIPQFKEAAIVMLADTVEAAIRSMTNNNKNKVDIAKKVRELITAKLTEGQLLDSGLTIKDIRTIEEAFIRVFSGMYHERIPYPILSNARGNK